MKKLLSLFISLVFLTIVAIPALAKSENASSPAKQSCTTIQSGELLTSNNEVITIGFDNWGYNYQARLFNGYYCDAYRDAAWCQPYIEDHLSMKWNEMRGCQTKTVTVMGSLTVT